jgi:hypothetical protein
MSEPCHQPLRMWTIYDHPRDCPDFFVARRFESYPGFLLPTTAVIQSKHLIPLRETLVVDHGMGVQIARAASDDPVIVEVWM